MGCTLCPKVPAVLTCMQTSSIWARYATAVHTRRMNTLPWPQYGTSHPTGASSKRAPCAMDKQQLQPPRKRSTDTCSVSQDEGDGCVALGYHDDGSSTATAGAIDGSKGTTAAGQLHCCARPLKRGACGSGGDDGGLFCQIEEVSFSLCITCIISCHGMYNRYHRSRFFTDVYGKICHVTITASHTSDRV